MKYSDENKASSLAKMFNSYDYVVIDTCSLMEDGFPPFMDILVNAKDYLKEGLPIVVYTTCLDELKKHSKDKHNDDKRVAAKRAIKILRSVKRKKIFTKVKPDNGNFADNVIYSEVSERRIRQKILIITQDRKLADDLRKLNLLQSQRGYKLSTYKILNDGTLDVNRGEKPRNLHAVHANSRPMEAPSAPSSGKPQPQNPDSNKKADPNGMLNRLLANDTRLWANLHNPNYGDARKIQDIEVQKSLFASLPEEKRKGITLRLNMAKLDEQLAALKAGKPAPLSVKESKEPVKATTTPSPVPAPEAEKVEKKPEENKPQAPATPAPNPVSTPVSAPAPHLYYGSAPSLSGALEQVALHYGILFRDPSLPYFAQVHGPLDVTGEDERAIVALLLKFVGKEVSYKGVLWKSEKGEKNYKVWLNLHPAASVENKPVAAPAPAAKEEEKKEEAAKPAPISIPIPAPVAAPAPVAEKKTEEKAEVKKPTARRGRPPKAKKEEAVKVAPETKPETEAKPETESMPTATLVVAIPDNPKTRDYVERKVRRELNGKAPAKKLTKSTSPKKKTAEAKPAPAKEEKPAPKATAKKETAASNKRKTAASSKKAEAEKTKPATKKQPSIAAAKPEKKEPKKEPKAKSAKAPEAKAVKAKSQAKKTQPKAQPKAPASSAKKAEPKPVEASKPASVAFEQAKKSEARLNSVLSNPNYTKENKQKDLQAQIALVQKLQPSEAKSLKYSLDTLKTMLAMLG